MYAIPVSKPNMTTNERTTSSASLATADCRCANLPQSHRTRATHCPSELTDEMPVGVRARWRRSAPLLELHTPFEIGNASLTLVRVRQRKECTKPRIVGHRA